MNRYALMHLWDLYHIASFCDFQLNGIFLSWKIAFCLFVTCYRSSSSSFWSFIGLDLASLPAALGVDQL